jgi:hypothetical protein
MLYLPLARSVIGLAIVAVRLQFFSREILLPWIPRPAISPFWLKMKA